MPETPAAKPITPAGMIALLRQAAKRLSLAESDACDVAADMLETMADPRFLTLMRWPNGLRNATAFRARCHLPRDTYKATNAGGANALAAILALREAMLAEDAAKTTETTTND